MSTTELLDAETVAKLVSDPNVDETQDQDVDRDLELEVQEDEHDYKEDKEPCRPMSWSVVHAEGIRQRDCGCHDLWPLYQVS